MSTPASASGRGSGGRRATAALFTGSEAEFSPVAHRSGGLSGRQAFGARFTGSDSAVIPAAAGNGSLGSERVSGALFTGSEAGSPMQQPPWGCWSGPRPTPTGESPGFQAGPTPGAAAARPGSRRCMLSHSGDLLAGEAAVTRSILPTGGSLPPSGPQAEPKEAGAPETGGSLPVSMPWGDGQRAGGCLSRARPPAAVALLSSSSDDEACADALAPIGFTAAAPARGRAATGARALARMRALRGERARLVARVQVCASVWQTSTQCRVGCGRAGVWNPGQRGCAQRAQTARWPESGCAQG